MRVIDSHIHLYPDNVNRDPAGWAATVGETQWAGLCTRRRRNGQAVQGFPSVDSLLREMDVAGVARAVLQGWYWKSAKTCESQNRFYATCVRAHPTRLSAFASIQPLAGAAVTIAEIKRARDEGLAGLGELSPHTQGYSIHDASFAEALALAATLHWPVNLHVTDPNSRDYPGRVETPLADFVRLARAFPSVNFILAHWGGLLPLRDPKVIEPANLYYDTAASPLLYDPSIWGRFLASVSAERVLFGSDYPLNLYPKDDVESGMKRFVAEAANAGVPECVLRGNAARLLGLKIEP